MKRCERQVVEIPGMPDGSKLAYTDYQCRPFPLRVEDHCEKENKTACVMWSTAGYLSELSAGFGVVACVAILFGVSTHSRRRRIWRAVAWLVAFHGTWDGLLLHAEDRKLDIMNVTVALQIATFAVTTDVYRNDRFPSFERARPGRSYLSCVRSHVLKHSLL